MYICIRDLREDNDFPQRKLAELLHVDQATYSRYETGALEPPISALISLADFYDVSIDFLLERTSKREINR